MRLPKPLYEALPFFVVAAGGLFIFLAMKRYEYAPTLLTWLLGIFCTSAGILLLVIRLVYRIRSNDADQD